jgi:hypothetical protein
MAMRASRPLNPRGRGVGGQFAGKCTRADHTDNWSQRIGGERASRAWRCRDLLESGLRVVLGSDRPAGPPAGGPPAAAGSTIPADNPLIVNPAFDPCTTRSHFGEGRQASQPGLDGRGTKCKDALNASVTMH